MAALENLPNQMGAADSQLTRDFSTRFPTICMLVDLPPSALDLGGHRDPQETHMQMHRQLRSPQAPTAPYPKTLSALTLF